MRRDGDEIKAPCEPNLLFCFFCFFKRKHVTPLTNARLGHAYPTKKNKKVPLERPLDPLHRVAANL